ncbi:fungal-specific transcription factor domain-containing protein [Trichoderma austrokoningii]
MLAKMNSRNTIGRGKGKRCRSGCWTCREAGYKCDEAKPFCGRCVRLRIPCQGYGLRLRWRPHKAPKKREDLRFQHDSSRHEAMEPMSHSNKAQSSIISPPADTTTTAKHSISDGWVSDNVLSPNARDPLSPMSIQSEDNGNSRQVCLRDQKPDNMREREQLRGGSIPREPSYWTLYLSPNDHLLFHHFITVVSSLISIKPTDNPIQKHFTSMALQKGPLQSVILSVAASHMGAMLPHKDTEIAARKHHRIAIQSLSTALKSPAERFSDAILATVLMLQVRRQFMGSVEEADECHLSAARELIRLRKGLPTASTSCFQFLLSLFSYHDILGSIAHARPPFTLDQEYLCSNTMAPLFDSAFDILHIASDISSLQSMKSSVINTSKEEAQSLIQTFEHKLETWRLPDDVVEDFDLANTAIAYHAAASIYLFRVAYNIGSPHSRTLHRVRLCLDALAKVSITSPLVSMHVWPLFTGGCEAIDPQDRLFAVQRLKEMYSLRRIPSLIRVREAMETVWRCKDLQGGDSRPDLMVKLGCLEALDQLGLGVELV